jgi:hypothetical protein
MISKRCVALERKHGRDDAHSLDEAKAGAFRAAWGARPHRFKSIHKIDKRVPRSRPMVSFEAGVGTSLPLWTLHRPYVQRMLYYDLRWADIAG